MTNINVNEDDKGDCDYCDDRDDWGGRVTGIAMVTLATRMTRVGGIR